VLTANDLLRQAPFISCGEQRDSANFPEVHTYRVINKVSALHFVRLRFALFPYSSDTRLGCLDELDSRGGQDDVISLRSSGGGSGARHRASISRWVFFGLFFYLSHTHLYSQPT
jgi:hypothetical protein